MSRADADLLVARWKQWERTRKTLGSREHASRFHDAVASVAASLNLPPNDLLRMLTANRRRLRRIEAAVVVTLSQLRKETEKTP